MRKLGIIFAVMVLASAALAEDTQKQDSPKPVAPKRFYQLTYVLREVDGDRVLNSRTYVATAATRSFSKIRTGGRVPYKTDPGWQTVNVGVSIDSSQLEEIGNEVSVNVLAEISSVAEASPDRTAPPSLRTNEWSGDAVLTFKQPTILFSSDDPASTHKMQLQLTVTPLH